MPPCILVKVLQPFKTKLVHLPAGLRFWNIKLSCTPAPVGDSGEQSDCEHGSLADYALAERLLDNASA
jgi:hypothetical protein